jgi:hypothetical protein
MTTDKNRKVAHPLVVRRAGEKTVTVRQPFASVMPDAALPGHKSSYMQSRLMRRCPRCGASGARVSAVSARVLRPSARFIEDNIVLCPSRRRRCHRRCGAAPRARSAQRQRQLAVHPSRPPRTQRIAKSWRVNQTLLDETSQRRRTKIIG